MGFGKLVFGFFLVGMGALLLCAALGYLPNGVWPWLARFWPVLMLAFGLGLLANGLKNVLLGVIALALVTAAFVFGGYWISKHTEKASPPTQVTVIDLAHPGVRALQIHGRTVGGSFGIHTQPGDLDEVRFSARDILGHDVIAHAYEPKEGVGYLVWPKSPMLGDAGLFGGTVDARLPVRQRVVLGTSAYFAFGTIDLTQDVLEQVDIKAISSSVRLAVGPMRPRSIRVHGFLSNIEIRLPAGAAARIEYSSPLTWRSFPDDFVEHVSGRVKGKAAFWTAEGKGPPTVIHLDDHLMRLRVYREPLKK
jgi:cell wall-active antibiotic response 4TMS protein YvqF